ncbi:iron-siderophore ABC transporter substrate-binding protein [Aquibacillus koreensis]|uniref:Iron-siderophore ABC transporter substrate-binding protein n=1 Tax=Aquibacillus koreensis TaxID=279446 RepID=A0A9X4AIM7_9BACI|nr:iron-siderophore ABC transporter substrate-binding protein [Aquibacillus koreensis]MCT2534829.1 iron-siderophore ABC transporter substrate-binding protein [Aquibacillus koreensis]MDC3419560.1 iron-siderophore ABC transporter substrate-binding protein [Aquibacillus koreensis]
MNVKHKMSRSFLFILAVSLLFLFGCAADEASSANTEDNGENTSNTENNESDTTSSDEEVAATEYPIVIEHAFGETTIESKPERVATIQWANHDVALALGVVPVGFSAANYGVQDDSGLLPWTKEKLEELGADNPNIYQDTDGLDFEAISDSTPDVILAGYSGITQEDYDILSEIAPVVPYTAGPWVTTWREQVMLNATGMGMKEEGEQLIQDTENLIKEKASEYPEMDGLKVAFANFSAEDLSKISIYTPADPRGAFLIELGMEYPESLLNAIEDPNSFHTSLSAENADVLNDADILIGYGDESLYEAVKEDSLLGKIPAIERGSVVFIGNNTPLAASGNPNPLSIAYTIDQYLELIGDAIDKVDE